MSFNFIHLIFQWIIIYIIIMTVWSDYILLYLFQEFNNALKGLFSIALPYMCWKKKKIALPCSTCSRTLPLLALVIVCIWMQITSWPMPWRNVSKTFIKVIRNLLYRISFIERKIISLRATINCNNRLIINSIFKIPNGTFHLYSWQIHFPFLLQMQMNSRECNYTRQQANPAHPKIQQHRS